MPKKPFKNTKMECLCKSNSRFKLFQNLKELVSNGPNPLDLLFKSCHWYDRSKKTSTSPVIPINGKYFKRKYGNTVIYINIECNG